MHEIKKAIAVYDEQSKTHKAAAIDEQHKCQVCSRLLKAKWTSESWRQRGNGPFTIGVNLTMGEQSPKTARHRKVSKFMKLMHLV